MLMLFAAAMFVNALLLFFVQPMFAKLLLPLLGGSPAVWTTCMLFFQTALLAGYFYSHALVKLRSPLHQALVHVLVIAVPVLTLPIAVSGTASGTDRPISTVLIISTLSVGAPFFALSTSAPLLQRWFAAAQSGRSIDPYLLYAASNVGSFASLLLYPSVIEPGLTLSRQTALWGVGYGLAVSLTVLCAIVMWRRAPVDGNNAGAEPAGSDTTVSMARRGRWIALAFVPSSLMLAVTSYLSTDIAAVPLLWVVPLALYLVTFVITFSQYARAVLAVCGRVFPLFLLFLIWLFVGDVRLPLAVLAGIHLTAFFVLAMLCHGALAEDRPAPSRLTDFYLAMSIGGALGGLFNTLIAPTLFNSVLEYPIVLAAGILMLTFRPGTPSLGDTLRWWMRPAAAIVLTWIALRWPGTDRTAAIAIWGLLGVAALVCLSMSRHPRRFSVAAASILAVYMIVGGRGFTNVVYASRTFFGTYRVIADEDGRAFTLLHGTTIHGRQVVGSDEPLMYFHRDSPIAQVLTTRTSHVTSVGTVGLGIGSLAAYVLPQQSWTFYEIDPEVERIARDQRYFSHLKACGSRCEIVIGDARLTLQERADMHDVFILDAFSSDAIPIHLLTREALQLYLSHLREDGVLASHISNNHLDLAPVVAGLMHEHGLVGRTQYQRQPHGQAGKTGSRWVALARTERALGALPGTKGWEELRTRGDRPWTDDFSNIWSVIRWRG